MKGEVRRACCFTCGDNLVISLFRGPDGSAMTTIPDHRGREVRYRLRALPDAAGVEMGREDGGGLYVARLGRFGWVCDCRAFAFSKAQPPDCKHVRFCVEYLDLVGRVASGGREPGYVQVT